MIEPEDIALADDLGRGQKRLQVRAHRDGPSARPTAAVRLRERLVQVVVDDVEAHVTGPRSADDGVEVGAVVVEERSDRVKDVGHRRDAFVEEAEGRRVRQHQTGRALVDLRAKVVEVEVAALGRRHLRELVAGHRHARRVRSVRGVGRDDRVTLVRLAAIGEVRAHQHQARQLSLRACCGLQGHGRKPGHLGEDLLELPHQLERTLRALVLLVWVQVGEAGKPRETLVDARVVLHRAGAERIEARVDPEVAVGEVREVTDDLVLGDLGQARRLLAGERGRHLGDGEVVGRHAAGATAGPALLVDELHQPHTSARTSASRSMSAGVRFSVTATRSTSSMPS